MCSSFEHTLTCPKRIGEREKYICWREAHLSRVLFCTFLYILYIGSFVGFSYSCGFSRINLCVLLCGYTCVSFSDPFAYGYVVMMLNVIRYYITIKNLTWYHNYPEISLCAAKTVLQLQLLKIRVSCLKTLKD